MNKSAKIAILIVLLIPVLFIGAMFAGIGKKKVETKEETVVASQSKPKTEAQKIVDEQPLANDPEKAIEETELEIYNNLKDKNLNNTTKVESVSIDLKVSVELFDEVNQAQIDALRNEIIDIVIKNGLSVDNYLGEKKAKYIKITFKIGDENFEYKYKVGSGFN
ncbi:MAG: hypothetical protein ACRDA4_08245 [Filifactoraceae bacterium]